MKLQGYANSVAKQAHQSYLRGARPWSKNFLRDLADVESGGDLDCKQLDILCDMIDRRITKLRNTVEA